MKKILLIAASLCIVIGASAQNSKKAFPGKPGEKAQKENVSPEDRAKFRAKQMESELGLSKEQTEKLSEFFLEDFKARHEEMEKGHEKSKENFEKSRKKMEKFDAKQEKKLQKILGEEKYSQWRSSHPQKMHKGHGHHGRHDQKMEPKS